MASARFWLACGVASAMLAACGSDDTTPSHGGAAGQSAATAGAPPSTEAGAGAGGAAGAPATVAAGTASGGGKPDATSPSGFRAAFVVAACENLLRCSYGSDALTLRVLVQTQENCEAFFDAQFGPALDARIAGAERGVLDFVATEAERCVLTLAQGCEFWEAEEPLDAFSYACEGVFEGHVAEGGDCASDEDCAGSARCVGDPLGQPACLGTCQARVAPGQPCDSERGCSATGGDAAGCVEEQCVLFTRGPAAAQGEPCGAVATSGAERDYLTCAAGLYCQRNGAVSGVCAPAIAVGETCTSEHQPCEGDAICVNETDRAVCRELTIQDMAGASCNNTELSLCDGFAGLSCADDATCAEIGAGACSPSWGALGCEPGQHCDENAQCAARRPAGQECEVGSQCQSGLCRQRLSNEPHRCYELFCSEW